VILGAGFAGLELATRLSETLADQAHTTLIDQNDSFSFGFSKLDVLFSRKVGGSRPTSSAGRRRQQGSSGRLENSPHARRHSR
jgi:hypothetical protein